MTSSFTPPVDLRRAFYVPFTPGTYDDEFNDGSFSGWTAVQDTSPTPTLTESNDILSILHPGGDSAAELHAWVKSMTIATGHYIEACFRMGSKTQTYPLFGLVYADGATYGAGEQVCGYYSPAELSFASTSHANYSSVNSSLGVWGWQPHEATSDLFMRLSYPASNNWNLHVSIDGVTYFQISNGQYARTLTPSHAGFFISTWGGSNPMGVTLRYIRFVAP